MIEQNIAKVSQAASECQQASGVAQGVVAKLNAAASVLASAGIHGETLAFINAQREAAARLSQDCLHAYDHCMTVISALRAQMD